MASVHIRVLELQQQNNYFIKHRNIIQKYKNILGSAQI